LRIKVAKISGNPAANRHFPLYGLVLPPICWLRLLVEMAAIINYN
jgi:hypothetical protein